MPQPVPHVSQGAAEDDAPSCSFDFECKAPATSAESDAETEEDEMESEEEDGSESYGSDGYESDSYESDEEETLEVSASLPGMPNELLDRITVDFELVDIIALSRTCTRLAQYCETDNDRVWIQRLLYEGFTMHVNIRWLDGQLLRRTYDVALRIYDHLAFCRVCKEAMEGREMFYSNSMGSKRVYSAQEVIEGSIKLEPASVMGGRFKLDFCPMTDNPAARDVQIGRMSGSGGGELLRDHLPMLATIVTSPPTSELYIGLTPPYNETDLDRLRDGHLQFGFVNGVKVGDAGRSGGDVAISLGDLVDAWHLGLGRYVKGTSLHDWLTKFEGTAQLHPNLMPFWYEKEHEQIYRHEFRGLKIRPELCPT